MKTAKYLFLLVWVALHLYLAFNRSICVDEGAKHHYTSLPFSQALYLHMSEQAPYHPGEFILGYFSGKIFKGILPDELWARIPAVFFGALSLFLALETELFFLILALFFSVSLTSFSTEFLSYTPLVFGGALVFRQLLFPKKQIHRSFFWINLFFGHLYGVCAAAMAQVFQKNWKRFFLCVFAVSGILVAHLYLRRFSVSDSAVLPELSHLVRQCLGALSNPHKAVFWVGPFFAIGLAVQLQKRLLPTLQVLTIFLCLTVLPILASGLGRYPFLPRQILGGLVPFLGFAAFGFEEVNRRLKAWSKHFIEPFYLTGAVSVLVFASTWFLYIRGVPPFVDQPLYKIHRITKQIAEKKSSAILWMDPATCDTAVFHLHRYLGPNVEDAQIKIADLRMRKTCWARKEKGFANLCLYSLKEEPLVWLSGEKAQKEKLGKLLQTQFDVIVHSQYEPNFIVSGSTELIRTW